MNRKLLPKWWWFSAAVVVSPPLVWFYTVSKLSWAALLSVYLFPIAIILCFVAIWIAGVYERGIMGWPACAAITTACVWGAMVQYSVPLVVFAFAAVGLRSTPRRPWILGGLGLVCQIGCARMLAELASPGHEFLKGTGDWTVFALALAVWLPAVFMAKAQTDPPPAAMT